MFDFEAPGGGKVSNFAYEVAMDFLQEKLKEGPRASRELLEEALAEGIGKSSFYEASREVLWKLGDKG